MANWLDAFDKKALDWLLESDIPDVRYLARRDLLDAPENDPQRVEDARQAHTQGMIAGVLSEMKEEGCWARPGPGYNPKYYSTVWALTLLAQLGAQIRMDARLGRACDYLVRNSLASGGQFTYNGSPSGTIDCLQGNLCWVLLTLGYPAAALQPALDWMARSVTGEGIAPASDSRAKVRYYAFKCGPNFACGINQKQSCAWGAAKVMLAFSAVPEAQRTPLVKSAVRQGVDFFFSVDPADAAYPTANGKPPSRDWWKFGFPVFYITDLLQVAESLAALGFAHDPRLQRTVAIIRAKRDSEGRWPLEFDYRGKTWGDFGVKNEPSPWVTLRALRVLKAVNQPGS